MWSSFVLSQWSMKLYYSNSQTLNLQCICPSTYWACVKSLFFKWPMKSYRLPASFFTYMIHYILLIVVIVLTPYTVNNYAFATSTFISIFVLKVLGHVDNAHFSFWKLSKPWPFAISSPILLPSFVTYHSSNYEQVPKLLLQHLHHTFTTQLQTH